MTPGRNLSHSPAPRLDVADLVCYPMWNLVRELILSTRSYREGADFARMCWEQIDAGAVVDAPKDALDYIAHLWLTCLDKMDAWEEYVPLADKMRARGVRLPRRAGFVRRKAAAFARGEHPRRHFQKADLSPKELAHRIEVMLEKARAVGVKPGKSQHPRGSALKVRFVYRKQGHKGGP